MGLQGRWDPFAIERSGSADRIKYQHGHFPRQDAVDFGPRMGHLYWDIIIYRNFTMIRPTQGQPVSVHDWDIKFLHDFPLNLVKLFGKAPGKGQGLH
jgi:hypothetical protein